MPPAKSAPNTNAAAPATTASGNTPTPTARGSGNGRGRWTWPRRGESGISGGEGALAHPHPIPGAVIRPREACRDQNTSPQALRMAV